MVGVVSVFLGHRRRGHHERDAATVTERTRESASQLSAPATTTFSCNSCSKPRSWLPWEAPFEHRFGLRNRSPATGMSVPMQFPLRRSAAEVISAAVGVFFGGYPARRGASLQPIEAAPGGLDPCIFRAQ